MEPPKVFGIPMREIDRDEHNIVWCWDFHGMEFYICVEDGTKFAVEFNAPGNVIEQDSMEQCIKCTKFTSITLIIIQPILLIHSRRLKKLLDALDLILLLNWMVKRFVHTRMRLVL